MKMLFALAFLLCIYVHEGYGLKCFQCHTMNSWEACKNATVEQPCPNGNDRCAKGFLEEETSGDTVAVYAKGCSKASECSDDSCKEFAQVSSMNITKCEIDCCSGDLCNGAKVPMVSTIMLLACALVAFSC